MITTGSAYPKLGAYYYVGCYEDQGYRAFYVQTNDQPSLTGCANYAKANNFKYFGLQNYQSSNGYSQCFLSNDLAAVTRYGPVSTCVSAKDVSGVTYSYGLGWTNAIYSLQSVAVVGATQLIKNILIYYMIM